MKPVPRLLKGCHSVKTALLTVPIHELWQGCPSQGGNRVVTWLLQGVYKRNFELNVTGLFQGCYSVETALLTVPNDEL